MALEDLSPQGLAAWAQILAGLAVLALPGLVWARRLLPQDGWALLLGPVLSLSILPLAAILLDLVVGVPVTTASTLIVALLLALWGALPWIRTRTAPRFHLGPTTWRRLAGVALVFLAVAAVQSLPHLPSDERTDAWSAYPDLAVRVLTTFPADDTPFPIHVDEHYHMAVTAAIVREKSIEFPQPYTGEPSRTDLFTVQGFRTERGFDVALAQGHLATDAGLPFIVRALPALWAGYVAALAWFAVQGGREGWATAAFVGLVPTSVHFLGPGLLIPIGFGLPWVLAAMIVAHRAKGTPRFVGLLVLLTAAFFIHLVIGVVSLGAALAVTGFQPWPWRRRAGAMLPVLLPLAWVLPAVWQDAVLAVTTENVGHPFELTVFLRLGLLLVALVGFGGAVAFTTTRSPIHRAAVVIALLAGLSMGFSVALDHSNDASYTRLVPAFFLFAALLGGHAVGLLARMLESRLDAKPRWRWAPAAAATLLVLAAATPGVVAHQNEPYYRVFDDRSWRAGQDFAASPAGPDDVFLSHAWQAPVYNAFTGAKPVTVFRAGADTSNEVFEAYLAGQLDREWLDAHGVTYVIAPKPPPGPSMSWGQDVYELT